MAARCSIVVNGLLFRLHHLSDSAGFFVDVSLSRLVREASWPEHHRFVFGDKKPKNLGGSLIDDLKNSGALAGPRHVKETVARRQVKQFRSSSLQLGLEWKVALED